MLKRYFFILFIGCYFTSYSQKQTFTKQDSLRGSITEERAWWDLRHYQLDMHVNPIEKSIQGSNSIKYKVIESRQIMQIDLQHPMIISKVSQDGKTLEYKQDGNVYYIQLVKEQEKGATNTITISYHGTPKISKNPPWDDGLTWSKDTNGTDFIATSCQGGGASIWWPCKDHMYDEPDEGIELSVTAPKELISVANGRLISQKENSNNTKTFTWKVVNPINNYGVNINIGDYVHFSEIYKGEKGDLDCDYYVLSYNLEKAKKQFNQATKTLEAFEYWFGPYPFYEDSFKLVEVPYLGMEHQSSVTYGNKFANGYLGQDLSRTGWGLKFDFIIVHESGHEWFANNITNVDIADMWVHEGFTAYSENLYLDYHFGTKASNAYVIGTRKLIQNDKPIIGPYGVNTAGSSDMYYKGANILHTLRQIVNDDKKWRNILRGLNKEFYHQTVTTQQIESYINDKVAIDLEPFFDQYLRTVEVPLLETKKEDGFLLYKWANTVPNLVLPVRVYIDKKEQWIKPSKDWQKMGVKNENVSFRVDENFYIDNK